MTSTLNIHFCGTQIKATRKGTASLTAVKKFQNTVILSGVGASTDKNYPTPGTFDVQGSKQKRKLFHFGDTFFSVAGLAWGAGEEGNIHYAMGQINEKMRTSPASPVFMNISGYSRGGASAIRLANAIYQKYGHRIQLNLFLMDPNAGPGRHHSQRKKDIPRNVQNIYYTFSRDEKNSLYRAPNLSHYTHTNPNTAVSTVYLKGNHQKQELLPRGDDSPLNPGDINRDLLECFYDSYGGERLQDKQSNPVLSPECWGSLAKKGDCSSKLSPAAIDQIIEKLETDSALSQFKAQFLKDSEESPLSICEKALDDFTDHVLAHPFDENYNKLGYSLAHLLSEIKRDYSNKKEQMNPLLNATTRLITVMNPKSAANLSQKNEALNQFKHNVKIGDFSDKIRQIAATIIGLVSAIILGVTFAVGGFFAGLSRWKTLGTAAIPCTFIGAYNGAQTGFNWGRRVTLGKENARAIDETVSSLITPN